MKSLRKSALAILATVVTTGALLIAQPADPLPVGTDEPAESKETQVTLTVPEMTEQIQVFAANVVTDTKTVENLQRKARKQQDVIKLNCINDALLQIKALRNIIDIARISFENAREGEHVTHYKSIADSTNNIRQQRERANICAGEGELVSDTRNTFDSPEIPDDPSNDMFPDGDYVEPPGFASPYK